MFGLLAASLQRCFSLSILLQTDGIPNREKGGRDRVGSPYSSFLFQFLFTLSSEILALTLPSLVCICIYVICRALFPGRSSVHSPTADQRGNDKKTDQLNVIFDVIGTPTAQDIDRANLADDKKSLLRSLQPKAPCTDIFFCLKREFFGGMEGG